MTNFKSEYADAYRKAYNYHEKHHNARTADEWHAAANDMSQFTTEFEKELVIIIYSEISRVAQLEAKTNLIGMVADNEYTQNN